jgi:hypothetical protein
MKNKLRKRTLVKLISNVGDEETEQMINQLNMKDPDKLSHKQKILIEVSKCSDMMLILREIVNSV